MTRPGRIRCEAVGCRRTAAAAKYSPDTIIICGKCWRLAPRALRLRRLAAERAVAKAEARSLGLDDEGYPQFADAVSRLAFVEAHLDAEQLWAELLASINEARGGLA